MFHFKLMEFSHRQQSKYIQAFANHNVLKQHPKSEFLSSICHELKTPLNAIIGFADILKHEIHNPFLKDENFNYINEISEAASDLNELIHDLLDVGQVSSGNFSVNLEKEIDVSDAIKRVVRLNHDYAIRRGVSLCAKICSEIKPIHLDLKRMKQVLMNLISNSLKYSKSGTTVLVEAKMIEEFLEISVSDQGFGMNEEQLKIAFTKYGTIANENSNNIDSLGLGLPITKQLVELQNGQIFAKSEIGVGTEMILRFPYQKM